MNQDNLFDNPQQVVDFAFDDAVADVFPDMIRRSVPGYETVISLLGVLAQQYAQPNTHVYDLGSSLGAATLSMHRQTRTLGLKHICVDNSAAMVKRCASRLERHMPDADLTVVCDNIEDIEINNASLVVINFTLQFLSQESRLALLTKIYQGLLPNGVLVLSEKLVFENEVENQLQIDWHHTFKSANGYSDLEISQKRAAIENVMIPDTLEIHQQRLQQAGFEQSYQWFQSFNFASL
ncbi:MAG: carboxy-S-adenosyl-L-methionine synthase CmoA, partial [Cocleimonas sp.]